MASILYASIVCLRLQFTELLTVSIITEIARNYQKDVMSVLSPFISASQGLLLKVFIHPETARGNRLVEDHF